MWTCGGAVHTLPLLIGPQPTCMQNLLSYSLTVAWGNNQGVGILSDSYANHGPGLSW